MSQDIEHLLHQITPRDLPPALRERVLAAVGEDLNTICPTEVSGTPARRRLRIRPGLAVAATLLVSLMLNHVVNTSVDRRLAAVLGPRPIPRQAAEIAADITALTDSPTGRWAFERLETRQAQEGDAQLYLLRIQQMIHQLAADSKETPDEPSQEDLQMDRDRRGSRDRLRPCTQRCLRLEYRNTA
jgi:hypothetical protein